MNEFGEYLKQIRGKRSLREMEQITGLSHTYLSTLEKGVDPRSGKERKPTPEVIRKLSETLDINYFLLLKMAGYMSKEDGEELYERRSELLSTYEEQSKEGAFYAKKTKSLDIEISKLKEEISGQISSEEKENKLKQISELELEKSKLFKVLMEKIDNLTPTSLEIENINNLIRNVLEYKEAKQIKGEFESTDEVLDLEHLFSIGKEIHLNGKILSEEEKKKALKILKLAFID